MSKTLCVTFVTLAVASISIVRAQTPSAQAQASTSSTQSAIVGAWTLNKDLSDTGQGSGDGQNGGDNSGRQGGSGGGRRRGGGGFGGGGFGRGGGGGFGGAQPQNTEAAQRMRSALRDEMTAPDHMTIVQTDTTVVITTMDGRTTRLSTDGKKVKDDSTGIERKTKWDGGKLVSEVNGLGSGKITETYSVDAELKQLRVALAVDGPRKSSMTRVYDLDKLDKN
jgi:hypothetical protein